MDWDTLKAECLSCRRCELCADRTHVVFGQGAQTAEVLFVGEGPGQSEDEQGNPYYKEGEFFLYGGAAPEGSVGTLTSEPFKLKGGRAIMRCAPPRATRTETN